MRRAWTTPTDELEGIAALYAIERAARDLPHEARRAARALRLRARQRGTAYFEVHSERDHEHAARRSGCSPSARAEDHDRVVAAVERALAGTGRCSTGSRSGSGSASMADRRTTSGGLHRPPARASRSPDAPAARRTSSSARTRSRRWRRPRTSSGSATTRRHTPGGSRSSPACCSRFRRPSPGWPTGSRSRAERRSGVRRPRT